MPYYDLRCETCKAEHESVSASIKEKSEKQIPCPACGSYNLESIFRRPPIVKGTVMPAAAKSCRSCAGCKGCG